MFQKKIFRTMIGEFERWSVVFFLSWETIKIIWIGIGVWLSVTNSQVLKSGIPVITDR